MKFISAMSKSCEKSKKILFPKKMSRKIVTWRGEGDEKG